MKLSRRDILSLVGGGSLTVGIPGLAFGAGTSDTTPKRIVSLGGDLTEIIYALGAGDRLVGRDTTSMFPPETQALPDVGYLRQLGAEGVLSLSPDLIIASDEAGPPGVIEQIRATGTPLVMAPAGHSLKGLQARIALVGNALHRTEEAEALSSEIAAQMTAIKAALAHREPAPRVLFILNAQDGSPMASGTGTAADALIRLIGGENVFTDHTGYKPLSFEAAAQAAPDAILIMSHSVDAMGGMDRLRNHPALRLTPAAQNGRIIARNGSYMLGFGPRLPAAVADISRALHEGLVL